MPDIKTIADKGIQNTKGNFPKIPFYSLLQI